MTPCPCTALRGVRELVAVRRAERHLARLVTHLLEQVEKTHALDRVRRLHADEAGLDVAGVARVRRETRLQLVQRVRMGGARRAFHREDDGGTRDRRQQGQDARDQHHRPHTREPRTELSSPHAVPSRRAVPDRPCGGAALSLAEYNGGRPMKGVVACTDGGPLRRGSCQTGSATDAARFSAGARRNGDSERALPVWNTGPAPSQATTPQGTHRRGEGSQKHADRHSLSLGIAATIGALPYYRRSRVRSVPYGHTHLLACCCEAPVTLLLPRLNVYFV